jgi:transcriptional regulator with XRE-family HTH domain
MKTRQVLADHIRNRMAMKPDLSTQTKLSRAAGVTQSTIWRALEGQVGVSIDIVESLAGAFGVSPVVMLADKGQAKLLDAWDKLNDDDRERVLSFMHVTLSSRPSNMTLQNNWIDEQPIEQGLLAASSRAASSPPKETSSNDGTAPKEGKVKRRTA